MTDFSKIKVLFDINEPCGFKKSDLNFWNTKYGDVPEVLVDYYLELGVHKQLNGAQDFLIKPQNMMEYEDENYLIFYSENQGVSIWGINKNDVSKKDPPVYENYGEDKWYKTTDTLTQFLLSMSYLQASFSMEFSNEKFLQIQQKDIMKIQKNFKSKSADSNLYTGVQFYGNYNDCVITIMKESDGFILFFSSSNEEHFEQMYEVLEKIIEMN